MSAFNWKAAAAQAKKQMESKALEAIILGPSGSGKSFLLGSFGCPTLYIYSSGESHGPRAAAKRAKDAGSTIIPICMDLTEEGKLITGEDVLNRLLTILNDDELFDELKIGAIAIDGAAELEVHIRASAAWKRDCLSTQGKHNSYAEPAVTVQMFRPIFNRLKDLQRTRGVHFAMTCMLDVKEYGEHNDIVEASPRLKGFQVAEALIQQHGDVLVVGPMVRDGLKKWKLQFMSDISKTSKDLSGTVKRTVNFSPRLNGADAPAYLDADLRAVVALKEQG